MVHHSPESSDLENAALVTSKRPESHEHEVATVRTTYHLSTNGIKIESPERHIVTTTHHGPHAHLIHTSKPSWSENGFKTNQYNVWPETTIRHDSHVLSTSSKPWSDTHHLTATSSKPWIENNRITSSDKPWDSVREGSHRITTTSSRPWADTIVKHSDSHQSLWPETTIKYDGGKPWSDSYRISTTSSRPWHETHHVSTSSKPWDTSSSIKPWTSSSSIKPWDSVIKSEKPWESERPWFNSEVKYGTSLHHISSDSHKPWSDTIIKHDSSDEISTFHKLWSSDTKPTISHHHIPIPHKSWSDSHHISSNYKPWTDTWKSDHKPNAHHSSILDLSSYPDIKEVTLETKLTSTEDQHGSPLNLQTVPEIIKISNNRRVSEQLDSEVKNDLHIGEILVGSAAEDLYNPQIFEKPKKSSPMDSLLRLSGCNIYGEMYKVGELIEELSDTCSQCYCTDSGVQCRNLGCSER